LRGPGLCPAFKLVPPDHGHITCNSLSFVSELGRGL
jgi:hypothetical protein